MVMGEQFNPMGTLTPLTITPRRPRRLATPVLLEDSTLWQHWGPVELGGG
jgi:hypothetical protein